MLFDNEDSQDKEFRCPICGGRLSLWLDYKDEKTGNQLRSYRCPCLFFREDFKGRNNIFECITPEEERPRSQIKGYSKKFLDYKKRENERCGGGGK